MINTHKVNHYHLRASTAVLNKFGPSNARDAPAGLNKFGPSNARCAPGQRPGMYVLTPYFFFIHAAMSLTFLLYMSVRSRGKKNGFGGKVYTSYRLSL